MSEFTLGYREVIPDQSIQESWREITLITGGTLSTLQDIKVAETANGYCYQNTSEHYTRNRFIYWRINYDILELVELSLDVNLSANRICYRFTDTPILDGISAHEINNNVVILVPTVCSIHRLVFPHPRKFHRQDELLGSHPDLAAPSIFSKAQVSDARNPKTFFVFSNPSTASDQLPHLASSYLCPESGDAFFILAYPSTELLLIKQNPIEPCTTTELKGDSLMPRFLTGLAEKFRQKNVDGNNIVAVLIQVVNSEIYILTLSRDGHLKYWSCNKGQCVAVIDILTETGDIGRERVQGGILRKCIDTTASDGTFAVFMNFTSCCQFHILKPVITGQQIRIIRINTLTSLEKDLIDFSLQTNRLWSAWRCEDGEYVIYTASLIANSWSPVIREALPDTEISNYDKESDPKQVYLQHIFHPGRFPLNIISKALSIYKRSAVLADTILSMSALKQSISIAVENEVNSMINGKIDNFQYYTECLEWAWQKFYSCCVQYHIASLKLLGLMLLPYESGAVLLKRATFSFLRPMEPLEHMTLCVNFMYKDQFLNFALLGEDPNTIDDIITLFEVMMYVDQQLSLDFSNAFEKKLSMSVTPGIAMSDLVDKIKIDMASEYSSITNHITNILGLCGNLYNAILKVLQLLKHDSTMASPDNEINSSAMSYFSSMLGVSFAACTLRQQSVVRFSICRNLLLICHILKDSNNHQPDVFKSIHSVCLPELEVLTQANYVILWMCGLPALPNFIQDSTMQRVTPIKLLPVYNLLNNSCISLLEMFIASSGGHEARKSFARIRCKHETLAHWHLSLLSFVNQLRQVIWPLKSNTMVAEWLLISGQHLWLQEFVKLVSHWCNSDISSIKFLLGASFLSICENYKALDLFQIAEEGISKEAFLQERVLKGTKVDYPRIAYYLKVIQLFELHKARDCAIAIADTALGIIESDNPLCATLYSIKFKHHLALKHYSEAFYSLKSNPDSERKKDNLRDLVKFLLDEKKFDILIHFTYGNMEDFFVDIILTRARATDAIYNIYYDFIYSYQIKRGPMCYRLAASVMYEQAFRLKQLNTTGSLEKQVKCYLSAKNALQLCEDKYAWVVRPTAPDDEDNIVVAEPLAGSGRELQIVNLKKQVEAINVDMIRKELVLASAKLKLNRFDATSLINVTSPLELVAILNNAGLFRTALDICTVFHISNTSVFETLTRHCVLLSEEENPNAWNWLAENDLQDVSVNRENASEVAWQLLKKYLNKYEKPGMTTLHKVICKKIISLRVYIPIWILCSYKLRNARELLRLLHCSGRLEEAFELVNDYLLAALGYGRELFGFTKPLAPAAPAFCLSVYQVEGFINELQLQNQFEKESAIIKELFTKYLQTASRISNEECQRVVL